MQVCYRGLVTRLNPKLFDRYLSRSTSFVGIQLIINKHYLLGGESANYQLVRLFHVDRTT